MKSIIVSLIFMVAGVSVHAQTPGDLFHLFKGKKNAEYVHLGRLFFSVLRPLVCHHDDDPETRNAIRCVRSIRTLDLEDCDPEVRTQFAMATNGLRIKGYHEMVCSSGNGERTKVLVRQKGNTIRELLLLNAGDDDCSLVQIKCKVRPETLETFVEAMKNN